MEHSDNPHMPKFISFKKTRITPEIAAIRMEPLHTIEWDFLGIHDISDRLLSWGETPSKSLHSHQNLPGYQSFDEYCKSHPHWLEALDITWRFMRDSGHSNDFHSGNCMMRGADTLVITDPVYTRR
jgi:hypothetical protein